MYNRHWLRVGTKIEMEHAEKNRTATFNRNQAVRIAKNHLKEHPSYYMVLPGAEKRMAAIDRAGKKR